MSTFAVSADGRGIDRHYGPELDEATGVIGQYIQYGDESRPHYEHTVEAIAARKVEQYGGDIDAVTWRIRTFLKSRCTNESTMFPSIEKRSKAGNVFYVAEPVFLDVGKHSEADRLGRTWGLPLPAIFFASLDPDVDQLYVKRKCEAIAVYWDPDMREDDPRYIVWNGITTATASDWDIACYQGIVRTFPSFNAMKAARRALIWAIREIHADPPTDEADEIDEYCTNVHLDEKPEIEFEGI
jgi:hypothetical protein